MIASTAMLVSAVVSGGALVSAQTQITGVRAPEVPLQTWYTAPAPLTADGWKQQATQLGNGLIGAMYTAV